VDQCRPIAERCTDANPLLRPGIDTINAELRSIFSDTVWVGSITGKADSHGDSHMESQASASIGTATSEQLRVTLDIKNGARSTSVGLCTLSASWKENDAPSVPCSLSPVTLLVSQRAEGRL